MLLRKRNVVVPATVLICGAVTLLISLCAHVASFTTTFFAYIPTAPPKSNPPMFPVELDEAALTTVKSARLGLFASDEDWQLLPPGDGFIYLPEHDMHYIVSYYHQLHCLRSIRHYFLLRETMGDFDYGHVNHCLIYLRQMVMCNVDVTLEPATHKQLTPDGRVTNAVTGVGVTHKCRDWAQVRRYMEDNYEQWKDTYGNSSSPQMRSML